MSLWEVAACIDGHNRMNSAKPGDAGGEAMSADRFRELTKGMH